jgi:hypothetical protein
MNNKKFTERLELLNNGRKHFLDYMRSLTPVILFLTLAFFLVSRLARIPFSWKMIYMGKVAAAAVFIFLASLTVYSSSSLFYAKCFKNLNAWKKEQEDLLRREGKKGFRYLVTVIKEIWHFQLVEVCELGLSVLLIPVALGGAIVVAMFSGFGYLRSLQQMLDTPVTSEVATLVVTPVAGGTVSGNGLSPLALELAKGAPTALIAVIAVCITYQQYRVSRAKLKLDLFEKRYAIFLETWKIFSKVVTHGTRTESYGLGNPFSNFLPQAAFLFGKDMENYLVNAIHKWTELWGLEGEAGGLGVDPVHNAQKIAEIKNWFFEEASNGAKIRFGIYLDFEVWK